MGKDTHKIKGRWGEREREITSIGTGNNASSMEKLSNKLQIEATTSTNLNCPRNG